MASQPFDLSRINQNLGEVFNVTQDAILVLKGQTFVACNDASIKMFNASDREQILNAHPSTISPTYQPCGTKSYIKANSSIEHAVRTGFNRFEWIHRKFDLEDFPVEVSLLLVESNGDGEDIVWAVIRDLTLEKKTNKELIHKSKLASIGQLAAGVGHEINNPLAIIDGNLDRLKSKLPQDSECIKTLRREISNIEIASQRIRKIVDGLRVYSRIDSEQVQSFSVNKAIEQTLNLIFDIYSKEGVQINTQLPELDLMVRGVVGNFQQVLMNLVSNAKDAVENSKEKTISIELKPFGDDQLELSVEDTGPGIPANIRQKILSPFFTTKEIGKGTGLGLSFVSEHVKDMRGELSILSKENQGSKFIVRLPLEASLQKSAEIEKRPTRVLENLTLEGLALVVDDEPQIREILGDYIESFGLDVEFAENGEEALKMITPNRYDYIFSDMKMPGLCGIDFITEAQKLTNPNTKYVIVTGGVSFDRPEERRSNLSRYINAYVTKPFTRGDLQKVLESLSQVGAADKASVGYPFLGPESHPGL